MKKSKSYEKEQIINEHKNTLVFNEDIARDVYTDYEKRREGRLFLESIWKLNMNYLVGNQYSYISAYGEILEYDKQYYWQNREVFNHIAPIIETRLSKLHNINSAINVRPASSDREDIETSKFSTKILNSTWQDCNIDSLIEKGNIWAEITGTVFYKIVWDHKAGIKILNKNELYSGDINISICSPYEIFPDELSSSSVNDCNSIIHAKAYTVDDIELIYNVKLKGEKVDIMKLNIAATLGNMSVSSLPFTSTTDSDNYVLILERYTKPTKDYPKGRLEIVGGGQTLYVGNIPYENEKGEVEFPFIRQACIDFSGNFFGNTIIERIIPVQRAYNAIKNKKHEYISRITGGVLAVEDGAVDIDLLETEGLSPGKIITYRQGSTPPVMLEFGKVPIDFTREENALLSEFTMISGVSDLMQYTQVPKNMTSGVAISLLIEQDDSKLLVTANNIRNAVKEMGKKILNIFKQHAKFKRLAKICGKSGEVELKYWNGSNITSTDIVFDTENEVINSPSSRKNMVYELLKIGILNEKDGSISDTNKLKILEMLGLGNWESIKNIDSAHLQKAMQENEKLANEKLEIDEFDNHDVHINEHIDYLITEKEISENCELNIKEHINKHKSYKMLEIMNNAEVNNA